MHIYNVVNINHVHTYIFVFDKPTALYYREIIYNVCMTDNKNTSCICCPYAQIDDLGAAYLIRLTIHVCSTTLPLAMITMDSKIG